MQYVQIHTQQDEIMQQATIVLALKLSNILIN